MKDTKYGSLLNSQKHNLCLPYFGSKSNHINTARASEIPQGIDSLHTMKGPLVSFTVLKGFQTHIKGRKF